MRRVPPVANPSTDADMPYRDASSGNYPGSWPGAEFFNAVLAELCHVIEYYGLTLDANDLQQVRKAIDAKIAAAAGSAGGTPRDHRVVTAGPLASPPGSPAEGDQYLVDGSATGAFAGMDYQIATYSGAAWSFSGAVIVGRVFRIAGTASYFERTVGGWAAYTFPAASHTHPQTQVDNLVADLAAKVAKAGDTMTGELAAPGFRATSGGKQIYMRQVGAFNRIDSYNDPISTTENLLINAYLLAFQIGDVEKMRLSPAGYLGIGTDTPETPLDVNGGATVRSDLRVKSASYPKTIWDATGNGTDQKKWQAYPLPGTAEFHIGQLNDAENAELSAGLVSVSGGFKFSGALYAAGDLGATTKVLAGGSSAAWKTLAELGVGKKIIAIGIATGNATVTFGTAEPDTSYSGKCLYVHPQTDGVQNTIGVAVDASSKSTGGCSFVAPSAVGANSPSVGIYIVWRD